MKNLTETRRKASSLQKKNRLVQEHKKKIDAIFDHRESTKDPSHNRPAIMEEGQDEYQSKKAVEHQDNGDMRGECPNTTWQHRNSF
jgi:hypothetical protein